MFRRLMHALFLLLPLIGGTSVAGGVYQTPEAFLEEAFAGEVPEPQVLWLRGEVKAGVERILGHRYPSLRIRYWQRGPRSAWILEEIGKEQPITAGIVVDSGRIERIRVLVFRESRGWEVRHEFFTRQFDQAGLDEEDRLDRHIDNVSGATLSVRAMKKLARLALFLDRQIRKA